MRFLSPLSPRGKNNVGTHLFTRACSLHSFNPGCGRIECYFWTNYNKTLASSSGGDFVRNGGDGAASQQVRCFVIDKERAHHAWFVMDTGSLSWPWVDVLVYYNDYYKVVGIIQIPRDDQKHASVLKSGRQHLLILSTLFTSFCVGWFSCSNSRIILNTILSVIAVIIKRQEILVLFKLMCASTRMLVEKR